MANFTQFPTFPIFSHQSGSEWLGTANFAWFATFPIFSHWSGSEWLGMANFAQFPTFPIFSHWSGSEWLRMANFAQFTTFPLFSHWSGSEWLGMANFARFATFPIFSYRSSSEWLRTANFTQFTTFPIFFYWSGSEWPILPNLQLFQSFSTKMAQIMRQCTWPPPPWNGIVEIQISVGTWSSTWMMIFTSWQSRLFVMEIVTLKLNLTNYTYLYTLDHNFVTIHLIWKKWRCKCAQHQGTSFSFFWFIKNIIASH